MSTAEHAIIHDCVRPWLTYANPMHTRELESTLQLNVAGKGKSVADSLCHQAATQSLEAPSQTLGAGAEHRICRQAGRHYHRQRTFRTSFARIRLREHDLQAGLRKNCEGVEVAAKTLD